MTDKSAITTTTLVTAPDADATLFDLLDRVCRHLLAHGNKLTRADMERPGFAYDPKTVTSHKLVSLPMCDHLHIVRGGTKAPPCPPKARCMWDINDFGSQTPEDAAIKIATGILAEAAYTAAVYQAASVPIFNPFVNAPLPSHVDVWIEPGLALRDLPHRWLSCAISVTDPPPEPEKPRATALEEEVKRLLAEHGSEITDKDLQAYIAAAGPADVSALVLKAPARLHWTGKPLGLAVCQERRGVSGNIADSGNIAKIAASGIVQNAARMATNGIPDIDVIIWSRLDPEDSAGVPEPGRVMLGYAIASMLMHQ